MALLDRRDQLALLVLQVSPARLGPPALQENRDHRVRPALQVLPAHKEKKDLRAKWALQAGLGTLGLPAKLGRRVYRAREGLRVPKAMWDLLGRSDRRGLQANRECAESLDRQDQLVPRDHKESEALRVWPEVLVRLARRVCKALLVLSGLGAPQARRAILVPRDLRLCSHIAVSLTPTWRHDVSPASSW